MEVWKQSEEGQCVIKQRWGIFTATVQQIFCTLKDKEWEVSKEQKIAIENAYLKQPNRKKWRTQGKQDTISRIKYLAIDSLKTKIPHH